MSLARESVGRAWLLSALVCFGCSGGSGGGSQPQPGGQTTSGGANPASTAREAQPTATDAAARSSDPTGLAQADQEASVPEIAAPDPAKQEAKALVNQVKELTANPPAQPRTRNDLAGVVEYFGKIVHLSEKALAAMPEPADRDDVRDIAIQAIMMMSEIEPPRRELLESMDKLAEGTLKDTPRGPLAANALGARALLHFQFSMQQTGSENDPDACKRLFDMAKQFATKAPNDPRATQLMFMIGTRALSGNQYDTAREVLKYTSEVDPAGQFGQMAASKLILLEAIGKPPEIAGPTLDGGEIDISQFKGKVVLVDFWATWCRPCVLELPNVQKAYDKYHDEGFEVIAVSFDRTKQALAKFVEDRNLPWPQIFFDEEGKRYWDNPVGLKYGISAIPVTFLIDRDGNLRKIDVRGEDLESAVVELLQTRAN
jgi:peroxiredoxin